MILLPFWSSPIALADAIEPGHQTQTILVLGDSISAAYGIQSEQGWVNLLQKWVDQEELAWQVVNASVSGETTGGGLARLPQLLSDHTPDIVLIELGGNDGLRGYPAKRVKGNLEQMVDLTAASGAQPVLLAMRIPPNYGPRYTRAFEEAFTVVAHSANVPLVPFFLESIALEAGMMQDDGIHPTAAAQPLMLDSVVDHLAPLLRAPRLP